MKKIGWAITLIVLSALVFAPLLAAQEQADRLVEGYVVGPGDVLDISVWKDEALDKRVTVLPDGRISFPLIGEITAGGKTVAELVKELQKRLDRYVPDVNLSLMVHQVNSMLIYVIGRVNKPGRFVLNTEVNVLQALAMAGGLNPFAKRSKIKIFRKKAQQTELFNFDYDDVAQGRHLEQNIQLRRGDVIVVP
jgi:polysaccharide export outer membrane protein